MNGIICAKNARKMHLFEMLLMWWINSIFECSIYYIASSWHQAKITNTTLSSLLYPRDKGMVVLNGKQIDTLSIVLKNFWSPEKYSYQYKTLKYFWVILWFCVWLSALFFTFLLIVSIASHHRRTYKYLLGGKFRQNVAKTVNFM